MLVKEQYTTFLLVLFFIVLSLFMIFAKQLISTLELKQQEIELLQKLHP
tara:strand:+ start:7698 stop:7844 length:147 start_codon:yes stop_codon:yes gene_type:complete